MKIKNFNQSEISNHEINSSFLSSELKNISLSCKIFKGDFYIDSFNFFPITNQDYSFLDFFSWKEKYEYDHFFTEKFYSNFNQNKNKFKIYDNAVVLGSSPGDNYYRNLITFIPRLLFIPDNKINLVIHRKSSNKIRKFIENVLLARNININKTIYLDDNFYYFKNSQIPQFFSYEKSIEILNKVFKKEGNRNQKIYLTRKNAFYRKIINESDLIDDLKSKNFKIIDLETLSIDQQIKIFSDAEVIVSPTSSALANIVFCRKETKIFEIIPKYQHQYEKSIKLRYSYICNLLGLKYHSIEADPVVSDKIDENIKKFINPKILNSSNYYKNLLVKKEDFKKFIGKA